LISGPRRLGKTSLLQRLVEEAPEKGLLATLVDVEGIDSAAAFVAELERAFPAASITRFMHSAGERAGRWLQRLRKVDVKLPGGIGGGIELQALPEDGWANTATRLQQRLTGAPVLVLIDEFSVFLEKLLERDRQETQRVLGWLRAWRLTSSMVCRFVYSGSIGLNSLLDAYQISTYFNDCYDFRLGPFRRTAALDMLAEELRREGWSAGPQVMEHLCERTGWLSPFYLNLLLVSSLEAARDRELELDGTPRRLLAADVDDGYDRLLATRSRFIHWYQRLQRDLQGPDFDFTLACRASVARSQDGPTRKQLLARLQRQERDPDQRARRLDKALLKLEEDGYLGLTEGRIRYLSFLLRDYWRRNHA
jgi:hypothetical protein